LVFVSWKKGTLQKIFVDPVHQECGLGSKLLQLAKDHNPRGLTLTTFQINHRARQLYEYQGFKLIGQDNGENNEEHEPEVTYTWQPFDTPSSSSN
jgi:GNAT superfamily N-acetyltransferase